MRGVRNQELHVQEWYAAAFVCQDSQNFSFTFFMVVTVGNCSCRRCSNHLQEWAWDNKWGKSAHCFQAVTASNVSRISIWKSTWNGLEQKARSLRNSKHQWQWCIQWSICSQLREIHCGPWGRLICSSFSVFFSGVLICISVVKYIDFSFHSVLKQ